VGFRQILGLNLIVEQIEILNRGARSDEEKLHVLRFNPWNFSDQSQLIFQFLKQFRAHLVSFQKGTKKKLGDLVDAVDDYAEALVPPLELIPGTGKFFSQGFKLGARGARKLLGSAKGIDGAFAQIAKLSASLKLRIVLIDDIDRLSAAETRQIFQLVKLTARFPYVTYVLAFDREAVSAALKDTGVDSGEEYLEKIVQVSFEIPPIPEGKLTPLLTDGIQALLTKYPPAHFDQHRFGNLFYGGARRSFVSVRNVRKFLNGLELSLALIGRELNGVDIVAIEALKTFYPRTFEVIKENKELFAGNIGPIMEERGAAIYKKSLDDVLLPTNEFGEATKEMLIQVFPKIAFAYGGTTYNESSEREWERGHRAGTTRFFDAYFQLTLSPSDASVSEVSVIISNSGDESRCLDVLQELKLKGKLNSAMGSLRFRISEVPRSSLSTLLAAVIQVGDLVSDSGAIMAGVIPEYWHVRWLLFDILDLIVPEQR
jgi:predicted KAP-like P-loop ATPase